ncbi:MAG: aminotransferase class V-fold PLP-dependent enzyme [Ruminococcaceae bacterium]|nr:aminotransferase class V-fold PLP-dependent enzyme [Oscillospiraceae bacterium]
MKKASLEEMLKSLDGQGLIPMHMPGHKRSRELCDGLPYSMDVTEIRGFDDLHGMEEDGCIRSICRLAEDAYGIPPRADGSLSAYPLVGGSTVGILAAIRAAAMQLRQGGDEPEILMARNCHKSVWHAAELARLSARYVMPTADENGIFGNASPIEIDRLLSEHPACKIVVITSPTYEGVISDIGNIGEVVHRHGALLLVDAAHGAHLPFLPDAKSIFDGADVVVASLHKTLPALTGCALLLLPSQRLDSSLVARELNVFETSSPSYVLLCSVERSISIAVQEKIRFEAYVKKLNSARDRLSKLKHLALYSPHAFAYDLGKLVLVIPPRLTLDGKALTGGALADLLRLRGIEIEMSAPRYVVAMTSAWDMVATKDGYGSPNIDTFIDAIIEIDALLDFTNIPIGKDFSAHSLPTVRMAAHDALERPATSVPLDAVSGKTSACYVWAYPPGIPLIAPGEVFDNYVITSIKNHTDSSISLRIQPDCKGGFWVI